MIISISGIDCSGKSTQLGLLSNALTVKNKIPKIVWYRPGYSYTLDMVRSILRKIKPGSLPEAGNNPERDKIFSSKKIRITWIIFAVIDTVVQYGIKVRTLSLLGNTVLCDRYIDDAIIDFKLRFPEFKKTHSVISAIFSTICPQPKYSFILVIDKNQMMERIKAKNEPFPDNDLIREKRFNAYQNFRNNKYYHIIDAKKPIKLIHKEIINQIR